MKGLRKRSDKLWEGRFFNKNKKPQRISIYFSEDEYDLHNIEQMWLDMKKAYKKGEYDPWEDEIITSDEDVDGVIRLQEAVDKYLKLAKPKYAEKTYKSYLGNLNAMIDFFTPNRAVDTLKESELELFVNDQPTNNSRKTRCAPVNNLFKMLYKDGSISRPITVTASGGKGVTVRDSLSMGEFYDLEYYWLNEHNHRADSSYKKHPDAWFMALYFGMRLSEVCNFKPCWVSKDFRYMTYGDENWQPKHRDSSNLDTLPILNEAKERLAQIIEGVKPNQRVFKGYGLSYERIEQYFKRATKAKFPDQYLTFHSLRKSFGMFLAMDKNLHPKRLHEMMRHGDMETTMKYYMSKDLDDLDTALNSESKINWGKNGVKTQVHGDHDVLHKNSKSHLRLIKP